MKTFTEFLNEAKNTPEVTFFLPLLFGKKGDEEETYKQAEKYEARIKSVFGSLVNFKKKLDDNHYQVVEDAIKKANCVIVDNLTIPSDKLQKYKAWVSKEYPWCTDYIVVKGTDTNLKKISAKVAPFLVHKSWNSLQGAVTKKFLPDEVIIVSWNDEYNRINAEKNKIKAEKEKAREKKEWEKKEKERVKAFAKAEKERKEKWDKFRADEFVRLIQEKLKLNPRIVDIEFQNDNRELVTRYMGKWVNPSDEEDYDWKELSSKSVTVIKSVIDSFKKKYDVNIKWSAGEKEHIFFNIVK